MLDATRDYEMCLKKKKKHVDRPSTLCKSDWLICSNRVHTASAGGSVATAMTGETFWCVIGVCLKHVSITLQTPFPEQKSIYLRDLLVAG